MATFTSLNQRFAVLKTESVPGTPEWNLSSTWPADADFKNRIYGIEITPQIDSDEDVMNIASGDHGEFPALMGRQAGQISFTIPLNWGGGVATEPNWGFILESCGLYKNAYGVVGIGWQGIKTNDIKPCTITVFDMNLSGASPNATAYHFSGCMGDATISCENNGKWMVQVTMTGKFVDVVAVANANIPELTGAQIINAERLLGATCTIDSITNYISGFSLSLGNDIQPIIDQSQTTGYLHYYIASRKPRLTLSPLQQIVGTDDVHGRLLTENSFPLTIANPSAHMTLYAPRAQLLPYSLSSREGLVSWEETFALLRNSNGATPGLAALPNDCSFELLQGARA